MKSSDQIFIRGLHVACCIGVPDKERAQPQGILISATLSPFSSPGLLGALDDDIERTIDYHAVAIRLEEVSEAKPRKLIETLAEDLATMVLEEFPVAEISIEIEKFILENTRCVGVSITRQASKNDSGE